MPALLALTSYSPSPAVSAVPSTTAFVDIDATNLAVTFVAPPSGSVIVNLSASAYADVNSKLSWNLRQGSTDLVGTARQATASTSGSGSTHAVNPTVTTVHYVTGLTPGATYTWKWGHARAAGTFTVATVYGYTTNADPGAATMVVWSGEVGSGVLPSTAQTGAAYTFALADMGTVVEGNSASAQTFTLPPNATTAFPVGALIEVYQSGAGQITVAGGAGVTLRAPRGAKTARQYATLALRQRATDEWVLAGDTA